MYCVKCGVELADSEKKCPLCGTPVMCADERKLSEPPYPAYPGAVTEGISKSGILFILTVLFALPALLCLTIDLKVNGGMTWSGYVCGALIVAYVIAVLPMWFRKPSPVIFVPCDFAAAALYLLYVNYAVGGSWFLTLALPVTAAAGLIVTAVVTLMRYTKGGELYIFGGALILFGGLTVLVEFLIGLTFGIGKLFTWSIYPLGAFFVLGMMLIVIAICRPLRESLKRKLFF